MYVYKEISRLQCVSPEIERLTIQFEVFLYLQETH